ISQAAAGYAAEVRSRTFPGPNHVFSAAADKGEP
ncbi:MAG: 3-methyl-2-oxobutanoate hydroxymethyltransferase, partial [Mesorhizobium sp.]